MAATMIRRTGWVLIAGLMVVAAPEMSAARAGDSADAPRTGGLLHAHWDYPAKASLAFGVISARMPANYQCRTPCLFQGLTVQGAVGLGAGEISLGYGSLVGETGPRGDWLLRRVFIGYGVRGAIVRTWGASNLEPRGATFLGIEGAMTIAQFGITFGVFHGLESAPGERDWRFFGGAGWGF